MKIWKKYDMDDPDDRYKYKVEEQAEGMLTVLQALSGIYGTGYDQSLSFKVLRKYDESLSTEQRDLICNMEEWFYSLLEDEGVNIDV